MLRYGSVVFLDIRNIVVLEVTKSIPRFNDSLGKLKGLSIVILMAIIYYRKRIQSKISKVKGA